MAINIETTNREISMEFLRRVVNELKGRQFQYVEDDLAMPANAEKICAVEFKDELLHVLPEITREFASKIKPEFTRCYQLQPPSHSELEAVFSRDPVSGLSIRCFRHWDVIHSKLALRFDAAFS